MTPYKTTFPCSKGDRVLLGDDRPWTVKGLCEGEGGRQLVMLGREGDDDVVRDVRMLRDVEEA